MYADVHVCWPLRKTVIVELDVRVEKGFGVFASFFEPCKHFLRAEVWIRCLALPTGKYWIGSLTSQIRIIKLDVAQAVIVQYLELGLVGFGYVCEVFCIGGVYILRVSFARLIAKMVPVAARIGCQQMDVFTCLGQVSRPSTLRNTCMELTTTVWVLLRGCECKFGFLLSLGWKEILQVVPLIDIGAAHMFDLARANNRLARFVPTFRECCDIWHIQAEEILEVEIRNLFKAVESWPESSPL